MDLVFVGSIIFGVAGFAMMVLHELNHPEQDHILEGVADIRYETPGFNYGRVGMWLLALGIFGLVVSLFEPDPRELGKNFIWLITRVGDSFKLIVLS